MTKLTTQSQTERFWEVGWVLGLRDIITFVVNSSFILFLSEYQNNLQICSALNPGSAQASTLQEVYICPWSLRRSTSCEYTGLTLKDSFWEITAPHAVQIVDDFIEASALEVIWNPFFSPHLQTATEAGEITTRAADIEKMLQK